MNKVKFRTDEIAIGQLPAMLLLTKMGWEPLSKKAVNDARNNRLSAVILEEFTREFLRRQKLNWQDDEISLTEDNIQELLTRIKKLPPATYGKQAEEKWDLLCLPQGVEQVINGAKRSLNARFIDFENLGNNFYHMAPEFIVEQSKSRETRRPDIVLFVNGIPLVVIENKKAATDIAEGISQTIRNQKTDYIPQLYIYAQILLSLNKNENRYATTGTPLKLWNKWRENEIGDDVIQKLIDEPLSAEKQDIIFSDEFETYKAYMDMSEKSRLITDQDRALIGLCRPDRLLKLTREFIIFDGPHKIIARFQQFDAVRKTLARIAKGQNEMGGVIWHTQGSGKSLTMVMLARALISYSTLNDARIVLVTDRVDLDKQIKGTFKNTGMDPKRASTGKELVDLIKDGQTGVITTIINKFETTARERIRDESDNIFVLVDEGHRSQYGRYNAQMRRVFPNANFIAFTGTPIAKKDRNTMSEFGPLIDTYTMRDAVADGAVIPLIYEGRLVKPEMNAHALDTWFERLTKGLNNTQKSDLKQKYARSNLLSGLDKIITCRAFDISEHFRSNYQGTGLKGQLVAPSKLAAVKYKKELDTIGHVSSEILISSPDTREGHESVEESKPADEVVAYWDEMMKRWGDEEKYNEGLISQFKHSDNLEIIIVVSKLLTGFDAPKNAVLYLTKPMKEHTLLQAIARVNRVLDSQNNGKIINKNFGYIVDYEGVLKDLSDAFSSYNALEGYDEADLDGIMQSIGEVLEKLPQTHSALLDVFNSLSSSLDEEAYEVFLADNEKRDEFYKRLREYGKILGIALGSAKFYDETSNEQIESYKNDLKRFINLRTAVKRRYAEEVDFNDYENKIKKILNDHIGANNIELIVKPINIFNMEEVNNTLQNFKTDRARADFISSSMIRTITEKMEENPSFYQKLSKMIDQIIKEFIAGRYEEAEYFKKLEDIHLEMVNEGASELPQDLANDPNAAAFHGYLLSGELINIGASKEIIKSFAKELSNIFKKHKVVDLFQREERLNKIRQEIDDYIYDTLKAEYGLKLSTDLMDDIQDNIMNIAERRMTK